MTVRLAGLAHSNGLLNPNQCRSLPGLSAFDTCLSLTHMVRTLQRSKLRISTLFLDIKAGFDNVDTRTLRASLLSKGIPSDMVDWISSFLSETICTLVVQGSLNLLAPVSVGTPQGSQSYTSSASFMLPHYTCWSREGSCCSMWTISPLLWHLTPREETSAASRDSLLSFEEGQRHITPTTGSRWPMLFFLL